MSNDDSTFRLVISLLVLFVFAVLTIFWVAYGSSDVSAPARTLAAEGYTDAKIENGSTWGSYLGCAENEISYNAVATNPRGVQVKLLVCCGAIAKACTVRVP